jgi:hypothetical protein
MGGGRGEGINGIDDARFVKSVAIIDSITNSLLRYFHRRDGNGKPIIEER